MLNALLTDLTERYHDTGHISPVIDRMMDQGGGFGHRVDFGHNLDGLLRAYELDGFDGMRAWADHILKDLTSPAGIPLPFSEALVHLTPLDMDDAVEWLSVNMADIVELGAEAATVEVISRRFAGNRTAYHVALAAGMALGFADDNLLLIAYSGARWLVNARTRLAQSRPDAAARTDATIGRMATGFERTCYWALGAHVGAHLLGIADILPEAERLAHGSDTAEALVNIGEGFGSIVDGFATFGLVFGARRAVRGLFGLSTGVKQREAARLAEMVRPRAVLADLLTRGAPPAALVGTLTEMRALPPAV